MKLNFIFIMPRALLPRCDSDHTTLCVTCYVPMSDLRLAVWLDFGPRSPCAAIRFPSTTTSDNSRAQRIDSKIKITLNKIQIFLIATELQLARVGEIGHAD